MYLLKRFLWHKGFLFFFKKLHNFTQSVSLLLAGVQVVFNQAFIHGKVLSKYCWNDTFESRNLILYCVWQHIAVCSHRCLEQAPWFILNCTCDLRNMLLWKCILSTLWGKALNGHGAQVFSLTLNKSCWMTLGTVSQLHFPFRFVNWKGCRFRWCEDLSYKHYMMLLEYDINQKKE